MTHACNMTGSKKDFDAMPTQQNMSTTPTETHKVW
jgi:hypothetical protein